MRRLVRKSDGSWGRRRRGGFTLIEVMISISIMSLLMVSVYSLMLISGRQINQLYGQTRTRSSRMRALDAIRTRLIYAQRGSVVISDGGHQINFRDPNLGGVTSQFRFVGTNADGDTVNTLYYHADIATGDPIVASFGPIDVTFTLTNGGSTIQMRVKSSSAEIRGDVDIQDGVVSIFLRNHS